MTAKRCGRDQGRVSVLLAITFAGIIAVIGVAADVPGQWRTMLYADGVAAEAARAAGQAVDVDHTAVYGQHRVNPAAAQQTAEAYLTQAGVTGTVTLSGDLTEITVTVAAVYQPQILGLFGVGPRVVTAERTAGLIPG